MKILVPTDFSDNALKAALYAAELAKKSGSEIVLFNVLETMGVPFDEVAESKMQETRKIKLQDVKASILSVYKNLNVQQELEEGTVIESILQFAAKEKVDLIIMGNKGAGKTIERWIGTVANAVVDNSQIPVLVIPENYEMEKPEEILFTTNHFEESEHVLSMIVSLAKILSIVVHVVIFLNPDTARAVDYLDRERKLERYVNVLKKRYPDIKITAELLEGTNFESAIELYHATHGPDISAIVSYPKNFVERIFKGSATKKMVNHSHKPVLAISSVEKSKR